MLDEATLQLELTIVSLQCVADSTHDPLMDRRLKAALALLHHALDALQIPAMQHAKRANTRN